MSARKMVAAGDYQRAGKIAEAREVYWEILRTFTGDAYKSTRLKAETELRYLDAKAKESSR